MFFHTRNPKMHTINKYQFIFFKTTILLHCFVLSDIFPIFLLIFTIIHFIHCDKIIKIEEIEKLYIISNTPNKNRAISQYFQSWQPPFAVDVDKLRFTPRVQRLNELEVTLIGQTENSANL